MSYSHTFEHETSLFLNTKCDHISLLATILVIISYMEVLFFTMPISASALHHCWKFQQDHLFTCINIVDQSYCHKITFSLFFEGMTPRD